MNKKILLVDDNQYVLEAMEMILGVENYTVQSLTRADNILKKVKSIEPNLILLDYLLSGETGKDVAILLKNDTKTKDIPIVVISAHPSAEKLVKDAGVDGFLAKPFAVTDLLNMVEKHIKNNKSHASNSNGFSKKTKHL